MKFAGFPKTVQFQLEGDASTGPAFPAFATDRENQGVVVSQVSSFTYSPPGFPNLTYRREIRRVTSPNGVNVISISSDGAVRMIDNLAIVP
jgi:hypothetical protein